MGVTTSVVKFIMLFFLYYYLFIRSASQRCAVPGEGVGADFGGDHWGN